MKILAFVDLHNDLIALKEIEKKAKDVDVVVCAGDFTLLGYNVDSVVKKIARIKKTIIMIPGNHELFVDLRKACMSYNNIVYLHKRVYKKDDYIFIGYGGGGFIPVEKEFEEWIKKIKPKLKNKKIILVTHAPPYNTKIDRINKIPCGNKSIRKFIERFKPVLSISGHLHECQGSDKLGNTKLINPGPLGKIIEI